VTPSAFLLLFPQFQALETATPGTVQKYLNRAGPRFNVNRWGEDYAEGLSNYVAHLIVTDQSDQALYAAAPTQLVAGDVTTKRVGEESIARDGTLLGKEMSDPVLTTRYGQRYAYLRRKVGMGGLAV
jgi:hypothetical protein